MRYRTRIVLLALLAIAAPATAVAKTKTVAPPGDSGLNQYLEVVPTAQGPTPPGGGGPGGGGRSALTATQQRQLNALGPGGRTLAAVVEATAPQSLGVPEANRAASPSAGAAGGAGGAGPGVVDAPAAKLPSVSGSSPASLILGAAVGRGGGGIGLWLPAFMLASLAGVMALVVVRRRRTTP